MQNCAVCDGPGSFLCSRCRGRTYCSKKCQIWGWKWHKPFCNAESDPASLLATFLDVAVRHEVQFRHYTESLSRIHDCSRGLLLCIPTAEAGRRCLDNIERQTTLPLQDGHNYLFAYIEPESDLFNDAQSQGAKPGDVLLAYQGPAPDGKKLTVALILSPWWVREVTDEHVVKLSFGLKTLLWGQKSLLDGVALAVGDKFASLGTLDAAPLRQLKVDKWVRPD